MTDDVKFNLKSNDLTAIRTLYDALPKGASGTLEVIVGVIRIENPSWHEVKTLHKEYGTIHLKYEGKE